jgi:hypothetical protein
MATVYLAEDLKHHRKVAIKVLRPELAARDYTLPIAASEPIFDRLRAHPRFRALRAQMGLP